MKPLTFPSPYQPLTPRYMYFCSSSVGERFREFLRSRNVVSAAPLTKNARIK